MDVVNIGLAFLEGIALILSPCILPILPIILSGSLTGSRSRPFGIIVGFIIMFTLVTLFSRALINATNISPDVIRNTSYTLLLLLGVMMLSSYLTDKFNLLTQRLTRVGSTNRTINNTESGFLGGLLFGGLIGIIWTPCAGPILAAVIVQTILQKSTFSSYFIVLAFAIGAGIPMLLIVLFGRALLNHFTFLRTQTALIRKLLGLIIIATVGFLIYHPTFSFAVNSPKETRDDRASLINALPNPYRAPDIAGITAWINSNPLTIHELKGKVVLIDFWTYSCINCLRTLPYLKDWYAKYHDKGFEIIGVHSPEFEFEKNIDNVKNAVKELGILYPVALDNQFVTWQNYQNQYWPAHYLINQNGEVVYQHFGEGEYDVTENNIRYLLGLAKTAKTQATELPSGKITPETYLGFARSENFVVLEPVFKNERGSYRFPQILPDDSWSLNGDWFIYKDKIVSASKGASIKLHFFAKNVYAVMGAASPAVKVTVRLNGKSIANQYGKDVKNGAVVVNQARLYAILHFAKAQEGVLELTADEPGLELYTFTFG